MMLEGRNNRPLQVMQDYWVSTESYRPTPTHEGIAQESGRAIGLQRQGIGRGQ